MSVTEKVCVHWPRFGPYHLARLGALNDYLDERNVQLIALETAGTDSLYDWSTESGLTSFERIQVFPGRVFEHISPAEMHEGISRELDRICPDAIAIHTYSFPDSRACLSWCKKNRKVSVLMTDTKKDDAARFRIREFLKSRLIKQYDAALLSGTSSKAYFKELGFPDGAIVLGYDVVDNEYFASQSMHYRLHPDKAQLLPGLRDPSPFFLASSRFLERKNLPGLLEAYRRYRNQTEKPWRLVVLGDGKLRPQLEAQVHENQIHGITFAGFQQIDVIPAYYGLASAFIHPAFTDQWALVVNEAMACGLPVIVSTGSGCARDLVIEEKTGYQFKPDQLDILAIHMKNLSESPELVDRMGRNAREEIRKWDLDRFSESFWLAVESGRKRVGRRMDPVSAMLIQYLKKAKSVDAFHSVES